MVTDSTEPIVVAQQDGICTVSFNRPSKRNAITQAMYTALADALDQAEVNEECRVVVFTGNSDCFTAGNDLKDFMAGLDNLADAPVLRFLRTAAVFPKPMVAAVNGPAVGIGTTLLMHCDLVVAGEQASFQLPFANLGLVPEFASSVLLPRLVGYPKAAEWLLLGQVFSAPEALAAGLINRAVPDAEVEQVATTWAKQLAAQPPQALQATRRLMRETTEAEILAAIEREAKVFQQRLQSPEFAAQVAKFFQRPGG
ncbi:MAG: enoyl-CoA hydratase [Natronospirillum sp.]